MASLENDRSKKQTTDDDVKEEASIYEDEINLLDYLKAYIKRIENKIANAIPLVEKPKVYPVAKGTVKKNAIVFAVALMMSVFVAFLLEGLKKSQAQTS